MSQWLAALRGRHTGIAWYQAEQYERMMLVREDGDRLPATFDLWLKGAQRAVEEYFRVGVNAYKIEVDVDELLIWCGAMGLTVNERSTGSFVNHQLSLLLGVDPGPDLAH
ncbi:MAG TPA: hypothetical protein VFD58_27455 [Blastocatellia bacterium]|nr:hypothetical protein [Blastocatellia bacterium]